MKNWNKLLASFLITICATAILSSITIENLLQNALEHAEKQVNINISQKKDFLQTLYTFFMFRQKLKTC